ncbi:hypothetical protein PRUPE_4G158500 [Prunus persica]|uniref:Uncharacterized protein n=1 Tax=Prunus persica TaxID=3760 RepID=A0A251PMQ2_PRUPE|nr:hypothetical protein PRUPE_4G158500 [Prunus persica]
MIHKSKVLFTLTNVACVRGGHSNWRIENPSRTKPEKNRVDHKVNNWSKIKPDRFGPISNPVPCVQKLYRAKPNWSN